MAIKLLRITRFTTVRSRTMSLVSPAVAVFLLVTVGVVAHLALHPWSTDDRLVVRLHGDIDDLLPRVRDVISRAASEKRTALVLNLSPTGDGVLATSGDTGIADSGAIRTYIVKPGETLEKIAAAHGTTVQELTDASEIPDPNRLRVGQTLRLPATARPIARPGAGVARTHGIIALADEVARAPIPVVLHIVPSSMGRFGNDILPLLRAADVVVINDAASWMHNSGTNKANGRSLLPFAIQFLLAALALGWLWLHMPRPVQPTTGRAGAQAEISELGRNRSDSTPAPRATGWLFRRQALTRSQPSAVLEPADPQGRRTGESHGSGDEPPPQHDNGGTGTNSRKHNPTMLDHPLASSPPHAPTHARSLNSATPSAPHPLTYALAKERIAKVQSLLEPQGYVAIDGGLWRATLAAGAEAPWLGADVWVWYDANHGKLLARPVPTH